LINWSVYAVFLPFGRCGLKIFYTFNALLDRR
jgi:hypothetical protein